MIQEKDVKRFYSKLEKTPLCWNWKGPFGPHNYGQLKISNVQTRAHRYSYLIHKGEIPQGLCVLHRCDNPPCVNPDHLFLGTQNDNVHDMLAKGRDRQLKGEFHGRAKLTWIAVQAIHDLYASGQWSCLRLGRKFGVDQSTIHKIVRGKIWKKK